MSKATTGERIGKAFSADWELSLSHSLPDLARRIDAAIRRAQHAERMICAIIVGAHREGNMHTKRAAPFVCDDIIRDIVATPKAATGKRANKGAKRG